MLLRLTRLLSAAPELRGVSALFMSDCTRVRPHRQSVIHLAKCGSEKLNLMAFVSLLLLQPALPDRQLLVNYVLFCFIL
jgi:hypothetical protein